MTDNSSMREMPTGNRLDPWFNAYAARAHGLRSSEIRALFAVVSRPEVVSLAGGMPNIKDLPLEALAEDAARLIRNHGAQLMQYGSGQGWEPLRQRIVDVMAPEHIKGDPDNVVITTGSQQALDLVSEIFLDPGDVVLAEGPSYVGALGTFRTYQGEVVHVDMDHDGLIPEALEETIRRVRSQGRTIKFLYTIPNFHNPGGVTLSAERRPQIVEICKREHILIVEDNPYGLLGFKAEPLQAMQALNPEGVIYLGSFSKMFAPGFRIGWALAPHAIRDKLILASESAILSPSMVGQMTIESYLSNFDWFSQVQTYRGMYRERKEAMLESLEELMPDCTWTKPEGGFYTWVTLPEGLDAKSMLPRAVKNLVAYVSGTAFYADGRGGNHLRLSFCYPTPDNIREGVRRLSQVVTAEKELVDMFGTNIRSQIPTEGVSAPAPDQI